MEFFELSSNIPVKNEITKGKFEKKQIELFNINRLNHIQTNLRDNESLIFPSKPFLNFDPYTSRILSKEICRIIVDTPNERIKGVCFFIFSN